MSSDKATATEIAEVQQAARWFGRLEALVNARKERTKRGEIPAPIIINDIQCHMLSLIVPEVYHESDFITRTMSVEENYELIKLGRCWWYGVQIVVGDKSDVE